MNRRRFLQFLSTLPLLGWIVPKETAVEHNARLIIGASTGTIWYAKMPNGKWKEIPTATFPNDVYLSPLQKNV